MLQRGWIKLFWGRCRDFSLKRLPKPLPQLITCSPSLMPTISTRCAFSYIAIWMRSPVTNSQISSKWQPEKSALPTLYKYKSLAFTIKRHLDFLPNDDSYNIQLKSLIVSSSGVKPASVQWRKMWRGAEKFHLHCATVHCLSQNFLA